MTSNSCSTQFIEYFMFHTTAAISKYSAILHEMAAPTHSNVQSSKATKRWADIWFFDFLAVELEIRKLDQLRKLFFIGTYFDAGFYLARSNQLPLWQFRSLQNFFFAFSQLNNVRIVRFRWSVHSCSKIIYNFSHFFFFFFGVLWPIYIFFNQIKFAELHMDSQLVLKENRKIRYLLHWIGI